MATYGYKAITKAGKEVKGSLEANNKDLAMAELRRQELTVINLGEQSFLTKDIDIQIGGWPKARDLSVMCRQFVSMTKAGVSILESLKMLCEQTENKRLQDALKEVRISVEKGETLADSMAEHPKVFPAIMVNMVAAGEASGSLETAMDRVATQLEKSHKTQAMVKKAMIYPIAVCVVAIIVTVVMLVKVIPSYEEMFTQLDTELPWITQFYVNLSHGIINYWFIIVPIIIAIVKNFNDQICFFYDGKNFKYTDGRRSSFNRSSGYCFKRYDQYLFQGSIGRCQGRNYYWYAAIQTITRKWFVSSDGISDDQN